MQYESRDATAQRLHNARQRALAEAAEERERSITERMRAAVLNTERAAKLAKLKQNRSGG